MQFDNADYFAVGTPPLRLDLRKIGYPQSIERHNAKSSVKGLYGQPLNHEDLTQIDQHLVR